MPEFDNLLLKAHDAFTQDRTFDRGRQISYGVLTGLGRQTISGMLSASGQQFVDWSATYRLFAKNRINPQKLFEVALEETWQQLGQDQMIIAHLDDTILKKTGRKIPGAAWRRDPLGPSFHTNFVWGQRFVQISLSLPDSSDPGQSRAIPVDLHHCPTAKKPARSATEEQLNIWKEQKKQTNLSLQGVNRIKELRQKLNEQGAQERELHMCVDGSYTNKTVFKKLPSGVTLIGRIRKDSKLHKLPQINTNGAGRKKVYGEQLPTPEEIRQSDDFEWQQVQAWAAGKTHNFDVKVLRDLKWRTAGASHDLQLVIIRPLGYRLTKKSKILYRDPAYLICTDPGLDIQKLLQAYLWRWEIEVNFRDEKTILGCGQAQVRNPESAQKVPAFITAIYAFILLAAHKTYKNKDRKKVLPRPKWYPETERQRLTTSEIINLLRIQLWAKAIGCNFSGFVKQQHEIKSQRNKANSLSSALFYLRN